MDGALLDIYVVSSLPELQRKDSSLIVKAIIPNPSTYGIMLSGHARKLERVFLIYLSNNAAFVSRILEENTRPVEVGLVMLWLMGRGMVGEVWWERYGGRGMMGEVWWERYGGRGMVGEVWCEKYGERGMMGEV